MVENDDFIEATPDRYRNLKLLFSNPFRFSSTSPSLTSRMVPRHLPRLQRWCIYCSIRLLQCDVFLNNIIDRIYSVPVRVTRC